MMKIFLTAEEEYGNVEKYRSNGIKIVYQEEI